MMRIALQFFESLKEMDLSEYSRVMKSFLKRFYIEVGYLKYWLSQKGDVIFDRYSVKIVHRSIILDIDPRYLIYALPWQILQEESISIKGFRTPRRYRNPLASAAWYRSVFFGNYNDPTAVTIAGGSWDQEKNLADLDQSLTLQAFVDVFVGGQAWENTGYFQYIRDHVYKRDRRKLEQRLKYNMELYEHIKKQGYEQRGNSCVQDFERLHPEYPIQIGDEIRIAVGRDNKYIFIDGRHRLAVARILFYRSIPARVALVHPKCSLASWLQEHQV